MMFGNDLNAWQRHFQPEQRGRNDGERCLPGAEETQSDFEQGTRAAVDGTIRQLAHEFNTVEGGLHADFNRIKELYMRFESAYRERSAQIGREINVPMKPWTAWAMLVGFGLAGVVFGVLFFRQTLSSWVLGSVVGLFATLVAGGVSFLLGHVIRQSSSVRSRLLALAALIGIAGLCIALVWLSWTKSADGVAAQDPLGMVAAALWVLCVALGAVLVSYLMRDADGLLENYWERHQKYAQQLAVFRAKRIENREVSLDKAYQVVNIGQKIITEYRAANSNSRPDDCAEPTFFNKEPDAGSVSDDDFKLQGPNEY